MILAIFSCIFDNCDQQIQTLNTLFRILFILCITCLSFSLSAQYQFVGQARFVQDSCIQLTNNEFNQFGSFWFLEKVDLSESFNVQAELFLGEEDAGADGIVFALQPLSNNVGMAGGEIGIGGISPSLFVEIDTWQNTGKGDPGFDHIAIMKNGNLDHSSSNNLAGPVPALQTGENIEDGNFFRFQIRWEAELQTLTVFFDCQEVLTYTGDVINEIFDGDGEVFWGFTAATGGARNVHQVCIEFATFESTLEDVVLCPGGKTQLQAEGGFSYLWSPPEGLSATNIPNPIASPTETTTYTVEVTGQCNEKFFDEVEIVIDGSLTDLDLGPDTTICGSEIFALEVDLERATSYLWSDGSTERTLTPDRSGFYAVTVTVDEICITEDWINLDILFEPSVQLGEDTVLCLQSDVFQLSNPFQNGSYQWSTGAVSESINISEPGIYGLEISNECGTDSDEIDIDFEDCRSVYLPTAFSPNADGINDWFYLFSDGDVSLINAMEIYDRWGNLLFRNENFLPNVEIQGWDGKFRNQRVNTGVYIYKLELTFRDGYKTIIKGDVISLR